MMEEIQAGMVVCARAGRDKDGFFVVLRVDGQFAAIADGRRRKLSHPKKKRLLHLAPTAGRLSVGEIRSDKQLRGLLTELHGNPKNATPSNRRESACQKVM